MEQLYRENYRIVYGYLLALCGDPDWAEDLASETFLKAIQNLGRYDGSCKMSTWLCTIGKRLYFNERKRRRRIEPVAAAPGSSMEERYIDADEARRIRELVDRLDPIRQQVFLMRLQGLHYRQIGDSLGKSETWARVTFFRIKNEILERLEADA